MADKALASLNGFKMFGKPIVNRNSLSRRQSSTQNKQVMFHSGPGTLSMSRQELIAKTNVSSKKVIYRVLIGL
jgi:hypothetical protein